MAKSNLRQKNITFNFGSMSDYSNSEEEQDNPAPNQATNQQQYNQQNQNVDFYDMNKQEQAPENAREHVDQQQQPQQRTDSDEELEYHLMINKNKAKKVNPFVARIGNQELQAS